MKKSVWLIALIFLMSVNVQALDVRYDEPKYLYTITNEHDVAGPPGLFCKIIIYVDVYLNAQPKVYSGMVCVGGYD